MAVTVKRGVISTQTDTTNEKRDISEVIELLDPFDVPLLDMVGRDSLRTACTQVKHEWMEDRLVPKSGTLASAYVAGSGTLVLTTDEGKYLVPDDTLLIGNIVFKILSGPPDSDTCVVSVIAGTDAALAAASVWRKIAHAAQEGGNARDDTFKTVPTLPYNYTQIIKDWILLTGTMEVISRYGYVSERAYQEEKTLKGLAIDLEKALLYSVRSWEAGPPRKSTMGGLFQYVFLDGVADSWETVIDNANADLTETALNNLLQKMWEKGAAPDFILLNGTNKRRITSWATPRIRTERDERTAGASIGIYESDFGRLDIVLDRHLRPTDVIVGTRGQMGIGPLNGRQFSSRMLPATGDYTWYEILGEYTMEVHRPTIDYGWLYNTNSTF
jgi:hypothetical protein